jgi:hypothetical protein
VDGGHESVKSGLEREERSFEGISKKVDMTPQQSGGRGKRLAMELVEQDKTPRTQPWRYGMNDDTTVSGYDADDSLSRSPRQKIVRLPVVDEEENVNSSRSPSPHNPDMDVHNDDSAENTHESKKLSEGSSYSSDRSSSSDSEYGDDTLGNSTEISRSTSNEEHTESSSVFSSESNSNDHDTSFSSARTDTPTQNPDANVATENEPKGISQETLGNGVETGGSSESTSVDNTICRPWGYSSVLNSTNHATIPTSFCRSSSVDVHQLYISIQVILDSPLVGIGRICILDKKVCCTHDH